MFEILPQLIVNAVIAGSIYALAGAGLSLSYGLLRILNFAHGHVMMVGAYCFYFFTVGLHLGLFPAGLITAAAMALFSGAVLRCFILPFSKLNFVLTLVSTLALSNILEAAVSMIFGVNVLSLSVGDIAPSYEFHGIYVTPVQLVIIASALVLMTAVGFVVHCTPLGRRIRAVSENAPAAGAIGIDERRVSYLVFGAGVLLASFAGILVGYETNMQPTMGGTYTIKAFAAMILGGLGNFWGTIAGSYILGLVENLSIGLDFGRYSIPAGYKDAFAFVIILLLLLVKPEGLFGKTRRKA